MSAGVTLAYRGGSPTEHGESRLIDVLSPAFEERNQGLVIAGTWRLRVRGMLCTFYPGTKATILI
jgi:hypothetical protein